jgi:hypothetical protein
VDSAQIRHNWGKIGIYCFEVFCGLFFGGTPDQKMSMSADHVFPFVAEFIVYDVVIPGLDHADI